MKDNRNLLRKFYKIIQAEKQRAQSENDGVTDVTTVAERVRALCKPFLPDLLALLGDLSFKAIIGRCMKRGALGFRFQRKNKTSFHPSPPEAEQMVFEGMEQFRGYPAQLTYEDKPGHVVYVNSRRSHESDRKKAELYLEQLLKWDQLRIRFVKNGNRFASPLVKAYGDLPLEELIRRWEQDHSTATEAE